MCGENDTRGGVKMLDEGQRGLSESAPTSPEKKKSFRRDDSRRSKNLSCNKKTTRRDIDNARRGTPTTKTQRHDPIIRQDRPTLGGSVETFADPASLKLVILFASRAVAAACRRASELQCRTFVLCGMITWCHGTERGPPGGKQSRHDWESGRRRDAKVSVFSVMKSFSPGRYRRPSRRLFSKNMLGLARWGAGGS